MKNNSFNHYLKMARIDSAEKLLAELKNFVSDKNTLRAIHEMAIEYGESKYLKGLNDKNNGVTLKK